MAERAVEHEEPRMFPKLEETIKFVFIVSCFRHIHFLSGRKEWRERAKTCRLHFDQTFTSSFLVRKNVEAEMIASGLSDMLNAVCQFALPRPPQSLVFEM